MQLLVVTSGLQREKTNLFMISTFTLKFRGIARQRHPGLWQYMGQQWHSQLAIAVTAIYVPHKWEARATALIASPMLRVTLLLSAGINVFNWASSQNWCL